MHLMRQLARAFGRYRQMNLLLADDLTGCCDAGVKFLDSSRPVRVALGPDFNPEYLRLEQTMLAINTDSRALPASDSASINSNVLNRLKAVLPCRPDLVYKKLDSTLRGNPGAEIAAIADAWFYDTVFIAPAAPALGRTVRNGILEIDGIPLAETAFGCDPGSPMRQSDIKAILANLGDSALVPHYALQSGATALAGEIQALLDAGARYLIFDSVSQADLNLIGQTGLALKPRPLFAGSAGLAESLAWAGGITASQTPEIKLKKILFVCGSANEATHAQLAELKNIGIPVIHIEPVFLEEDISTYMACAVVLLRKGSVCLAITQERVAAEEAARQIRALGVITRLILRENETAGLGLFLTGGETAVTVLRDIASFITLKGEIMPGIVLSELVDGKWQGLPVITKAGGFGPPSTFLDLIQTLT